MRAAFAIAALAGSVVAAPSYGHGHGHPQPQGDKNVHLIVETVVETVVETLYVTEGYEVPRPTHHHGPGHGPPAVTTTVHSRPARPSKPAESSVVSSSVVVAPTPVPEAPKPTPTPEPSLAPAPEYPAPEPSPAPEYPAPEPSPAPEYPAPPSNVPSYMAIVDQYRGKMGMAPLQWDAKLQNNALLTVKASHGKMVHNLHPGTMGQVLAPAPDTREGFKSAFAGGWICEMPSLLKSYASECSSLSERWNYRGQTGHAEILSNPAMKKIGCAVSQGIHCCDLGY